VDVDRDVCLGERDVELSSRHARHWPADPVSLPVAVQEPSQRQLRTRIGTRLLAHPGGDTG
jgi:hypothetical protein